MLLGIDIGWLWDSGCGPLAFTYI